MHETKVALIGANSRIGPAILNALLTSTLSLSLTILLRPSSHPIPSSDPRLRLITVPSDPPTVPDLAAALDDIEILICALSPSDVGTQIALADACVIAGVQRFVPADYGSMRSDDSVVLSILPNFRNKQRVRQHCMELAKKHGELFTWTSLVTGHFFDYGLKTELLGLDVEGRRAKVLDGGSKKWSTSTTWQIGKAVVGIIQKWDETANKMLLVQSFRISQLEVIDAIERLDRQEDKGKGPSNGKFERIQVDSKEYIKEKRTEAERGDEEAVEELVAVLGILRSDWKGEELFANRLLALQEEDMAQVVARVLSDKVT